MDEMVGAASAVVVALITAVVTISTVIRDRSGLHHLEKLGIVIHSMKPTSVQRKMLETIRDEVATEWGVKALGRREKKKLRGFLYGLGLLCVSLLVWTAGYSFLQWAWIPYPPDWVSWVMGIAYLAWLVLFYHRAHRLQVWELNERAVRKLPSEP